jgi:3-deoxy-D-manno-octulosonate 8-phosphate phosphatase (KDO 8-P phosphatase)
LCCDYYHHTDKPPLSAIITGQENPTALDFARRESFSAIYFNIKNKNEAFAHFCQANNLQPQNIAWFFDDILDLGIAKECGLRFYLGRNSQPLTTQFVIANNMADYISANSGGQHALRECCELAMGLNGNFDQLLNNRLSFNDNYAEYFTNRNAIKPVVFTKKESGIEEVK